MAKERGPGMEDDWYEALRQGVGAFGQQKAGRRRRSTPRYEDWSRDDLYHRAAEIGIEQRAQMTRQELIDALRNH